MGTISRHLLAEYYHCSSVRLDDIEAIEVCLRDAAEAAGTTVLDVKLHRFAPQGVSGVAILAASHLAIHTWPEYGFATIEIFVCDSSADPWLGHACLERAFGPAHVDVREIERGDPARVMARAAAK